jgi:hypothetical protein
MNVAIGYNYTPMAYLWQPVLGRSESGRTPLLTRGERSERSGAASGYTVPLVAHDVSSQV